MILSDHNQLRMTEPFFFIKSRILFATESGQDSQLNRPAMRLNTAPTFISGFTEFSKRTLKVLL